MSVVIDGMNLPQKCGCCACCQYDEFEEAYCEAGGTIRYISNPLDNRFPECPMRDYPDPQKPKKDGALYRCPSCGKLVGEKAYIRYHKQQFCSDCGQRIDWGDGYHYPKGEQDDERKADG